LRKPHESRGTWEARTDSPVGNEAYPINAVTWYEAFAFCIWDGGRSLSNSFKITAPHVHLPARDLRLVDAWLCFLNVIPSARKSTCGWFDSDPGHSFCCLLALITWWWVIEGKLFRRRH